ncbi:hypothetical protein BGX33_000098 [Mortierella sp. NVP41]|nr:hypothetical protein BGX33_000098 [Mortierella sp. NVP41]
MLFRKLLPEYSPWWSKLIVFGGIINDKDITTIAVNSKYILDVTTLTWSAGHTSDVRGDPRKLLYFNFVTNQWFDEVSINKPKPGAATTTPAATPSSPPVPNLNLNQKSSTNNAGAIGGGIAAAVVIGAIIGILVVRRRRQSKQKQIHVNSPSKLIPNKNPQWDKPDDNHSTIDSQSVTANDAQDASQVPMQDPDPLPGPHKYLVDQYNGPQHTSPYVSTNGQFNPHQQQHQQQQQLDGLVWSRAPQDTSESPMRPIEVEDPDELLAQVKAKHEERRERIRQERETDLQRFREQWQTDIPGKAEL